MGNPWGALEMQQLNLEPAPGEPNMNFLGVCLAYMTSDLDIEKILLRRYLDPHKTVYKHTHLKHQTSQNIFSYFFMKYTHLIRHSP